MVIQHNLPAMNSHRQLGLNNSSTSTNLEKLSSGYRINRAADDAAGLAISEKMRGQIRGLAMATQNSENGISLIQTAEGGLNETHAILQRMRELAVQASNGTYHDEVDRENIAKEVESLKSEIDRIASSTHYNGINLLDGTLGGKTVEGSKLEAAAQEIFGSSTTLTGLSFGLKTAATTDPDVADALAEMGLTSGATVSATLIMHEDGSAALQIGDKTLTSTDGTDFVYRMKDGSTVALFSGTITSSLNGSEAFVVSGMQIKLDTAATSVLTQTDKLMIAGKSSQLVFQIGANGGLDQKVGLHVDNMSTANLGNDSAKVADIKVGAREDANDAIEVINAAINQVSGTRADLGALQNRLEHTINNLGVTKENLQAAESSIRDVDMAKEMMEFTKNNILVQASQSMLSQANQLPQGVLQLLS